MKYRRNGKLLDTDTAELIFDNGGTKLLRNRRSEFFLMEKLKFDKVKVSWITAKEANEMLSEYKRKSHPDYMVEVKDKRVCFYLEKEYLPELKSLSTKKGLSANEYVKWLIKEKLAKEKEKQRLKEEK